MTKLQNIYNAVDDFNLITSAETTKLGMSNAEMVQQKAKGRLVRVGWGVYRIPVWPFQEQAPNAIAVKAVGDGQVLRYSGVVSRITCMYVTCLKTSLSELLQSHRRPHGRFALIADTDVVADVSLRFADV